MVLIWFANIHKHVHVVNQATPFIAEGSLMRYVCACVFKIFSETIGPTEAKFHVEPQWDRGIKFIQIIPVICCSSFEYCQPLGAGAFHRALTTNVAPQSSWAFSRSLEIKS